MYHEAFTVDQYSQLYIQSRIIKLMCRWFMVNLTDWKDVNLVKAMNKFLESLKAGNDLQQLWSMIIVKFWRSSIYQLSAEEHRPAIWPGAPKIIVTGKVRQWAAKTDNLERRDFQSLSSLDFNVDELARQMTLLDHSYFAAIPFEEIFTRKYDSEQITPKIAVMKKHFNAVTYWISTEVATTPNIKKRVKTLTHCINLADKLKKYHNWNGFLAVVTGLVQYPVTRMRQTWKGLHPNVIKKWEYLEKLASPLDNFKNLRESYLSSPPPLVLPISILLKDLTFVEDGNKDWFNESSGILNFYKVELLGRVLGRMNESQHIHFPLSQVSIIQEYLKNLFYVDDMDILEAQSKQIEPPLKDV
uniref:Ras-GEF domain-containing protein n=1 Tax=Arcella intermedia TaxID=1963864 RepID=A0A6B2L791_9EUKA